MSTFLDIEKIKKNKNNFIITSYFVGFFLVRIYTECLN